MIKVLSIIASVLVGGLIGIFCLFSCMLSSRADAIWEEIKRGSNDD